MYRVFSVVFALLLFSQQLEAQDEFYVKSLAIDVRDLTARTSPRHDMNGKPCALLKVVAMDDIVSCGGANIGDISTEGLVKLVYVPAVVKSIRINFKYHFPIEVTFTDYGITRLEGQSTYNLILTAQKSEAAVVAGRQNEVAIAAVGQHKDNISVVQQPVPSQNNVSATQISQSGLTKSPVVVPQNSSVDTSAVHYVIVDDKEKLPADGIDNPVIANLVRNMVYVSGGSFLMGATNDPKGVAASDERPIHAVYLKSFFIGKYEVTQAEWENVMGSDANFSHYRGFNRPVENVSWYKCQEFIQKLNAMTGMNFRLPTEAEWEYAARGGSKSLGYMYAGSDDVGEVAWYTSKMGGPESHVYKIGVGTNVVGSKKPNELGLYDMSGNVAEWCSDWKVQYSTRVVVNPDGGDLQHDILGEKVIRGGDWLVTKGNPHKWYTRVSARSSRRPNKGDSFIGFRLAL